MSEVEAVVVWREEELSCRLRLWEVSGMWKMCEEQLRSSARGWRQRDLIVAGSNDLRSHHKS